MRQFNGCVKEFGRYLMPVSTVDKIVYIEEERMWALVGHSFAAHYNSINRSKTNFVCTNLGR
jgi:hypothetical protein